MAEELRGERALVRLRQLAREQRDAAARGDVRMICHIASLVPSATAGLCAEELQSVPGVAEALAEIREAQAASVTLLEARMDEIRARLNQIAVAKRSLRSYGRRVSRGPRRVDNQG